VREEIDTSNATGRMVADVLTSLAELELAAKLNVGMCLLESGQ